MTPERLLFPIAATSSALPLRIHFVQSGCCSPLLTWRKPELASIWPRPQTPGGSSYWSPGWSRSCRCRGGTLASARPLRGQRRVVSLTWRRVSTHAHSLCWSVCELQVSADVQELLRVRVVFLGVVGLSCLQLWASCLCITVWHTTSGLHTHLSTYRHDEPEWWKSRTSCKEACFIIRAKFQTQEIHFGVFDFRVEFVENCEKVSD